MIAKTVTIVFTVREARLLLDAASASLDDQGNPSKKWFPKAGQRKAVKRAVDKLRDAWFKKDNHRFADL